MAKFDISITEVKKIEYHTKEVNLLGDNGPEEYNCNVPVHSKLVLDFKGADLNNVLLNTLRRVSLNDIPTYAFTSELIQISDNTTIFNNDFMRLQISQLPILNTKLDLHYLDPIYWKNIDYSDPKRPRHEAEKLIEMHINAYNDTPNIKHITTNDIRYYEDGEEVFEKYNKTCPVLLLSMKQSDTFKCSAKASLGIGQRNDIWAAASVTYYDDHTTDDIEGKFVELKTPHVTFTVESQGQMDEYIILIKACKFIIKKMGDIKNELDKRIKTKEIYEARTINFELLNEDHTVGQLIDYYFKEHPDIIYSGMSKPDHLSKIIKLRISCSKNVESPVKPMFEQIDHIIDIYNYLEQQITKLSGTTTKPSKKQINKKQKK